MNHIVLVALGSVFGGLSRYYMSGAFYRLLGFAMPWGTWVVNVLGCTVIGFVSTWGEGTRWYSPSFKLIFFIGFLGSFTTFSTFALETWQLLAQGSALKAALNIAMSLVGCFGGLLLGVWLARSW